MDWSACEADYTDLKGLRYWLITVILVMMECVPEQLCQNKKKKQKRKKKRKLFLSDHQRAVVLPQSLTLHLCACVYGTVCVSLSLYILHAHFLLSHMV